MEHTVHENHVHQHSENCGHTRIKHGDHFDYLHDGCLHATHESHYDECTLPVTDQNPAECKEITCQCDHKGCGHELVPHGDHKDYLVNGRLHHHHDGHCDDHGEVFVM